MNTVGIVLLAFAGSVVAYAYAGYPVLLKLLTMVRRPRTVRSPAQHEGEWPAISITVPAYNEERAIAATLDRLLACDYPVKRRQIMVVSDASTDRTEEIVKSYADAGVELLRMEQRGGKTAAENAAWAHLTGSIVINTDASVRVDAAALRHLVAALDDPEVGVASSRDVSMANVDSEESAGEAGYVGYEMWVRGLETTVSGIVGASGSLYAIRRELHRSLVPSALSRDFAAALNAREAGFRSVSVDDALCYVPRSTSLHAEYRRKVRTMARGLETLWYKRHLMNPVRYRFFAWMLVSHKLIRWLLPWAAVLALVGLLLLADDCPPARWALAAFSVAVLASLLAWYWPPDRRMPRLLALPAYTVCGTLAALQAWGKALRGELNPIWEPTRRA